MSAGVARCSVGALKGAAYRATVERAPAPVRPCAARRDVAGRLIELAQGC